MRPEKRLIGEIEGARCVGFPCHLIRPIIPPHESHARRRPVPPDRHCRQRGNRRRRRSRGLRGCGRWMLVVDEPARTREIARRRCGSGRQDQPRDQSEQADAEDERGQRVGRLTHPLAARNGPEHENGNSGDHGEDVVAHVRLLPVGQKSVNMLIPAIVHRFAIDDLNGAYTINLCAGLPIKTPRCLDTGA